MRLIHRGTGTLVPSTCPGYASSIPATKTPSPLTASPEVSSKSSTTPSIVAQLRQIHGLTKKNLPGPSNHPPPRATLFTSERPDNTLPQAPSQPLIPGDVEEHLKHTYPLENPGGKSQTRSRDERRERLVQRNTTNSPPARIRKATLNPSLPDYATLLLPPVSPYTTHNMSSSEGLSKDPAMVPPLVPLDLADLDTCSLGSSHFPPIIDLPSTLASACSPETRVDSCSPLISTRSPIHPVSRYNIALHDPSSLSALSMHNTRPEGVGDIATCSQVLSAHMCPTGTYALPLGTVDPVSYHWDSYNGLFTSPSSHASGGYDDYQGGLDPTCLETNYSASETPSYSPAQPQSFYHNHQDSGANYHSPPPPLLDPGLSPSSSTVSSVAVAGVTTSQALGLDYRTSLPDSDLPQFHHTTSSSLSAMINPKLENSFSPGGGK